MEIVIRAEGFLPTDTLSSVLTKAEGTKGLE